GNRAGPGFAPAEAGLRRDVGEASVAVVAEQQVAQLVVAGHGAEEKEIGPAVAIEVECDDNTTETLPHGAKQFGQLLRLRPARPAGEGDCEAGLLEEWDRAGPGGWPAVGTAADQLGILPH